MPTEIPQREMFQCVLQAITPMTDDGKGAKGTAFFMKMDGESMVCTAYHVFSTIPSLKTSFPLVNPQLDFAVLNGGGFEYPSTQFCYGSADSLCLGDDVYYGGYPFATNTPHVFKGTVSAIDWGASGTQRSIRIDGTAVRGMSGGPIFMQNLVKQGGVEKYIPIIIGFLASQTFDPVDQFKDALMGLSSQLKELDSAQQFNYSIQEEFAAHSRETAKIPPGGFYSVKLDASCNAREATKNFKVEIWDNLNRNGVLNDDGRLNADAELTPVKIQSCLDDKYKPYVHMVIDKLQSLQRQAQRTADDVNPDNILGIPAQPTDDLARVGMSLVNSMSTGIVTGYFIEDALKHLETYDSEKHTELANTPDDQFEIGRIYKKIYEQHKDENPQKSDDEINEYVLSEVTKYGGKYGTTSEKYSRSVRIAECDHFPPEDVYESSPETHIKTIKSKDMGALMLRAKDHISFITTGSSTRAKEFRAEQSKCFKVKNYYGAIKMNLDAYNKANLITKNNQGGIKDALNVHMKNRLISAEQVASLYALVCGYAEMTSLFAMIAYSTGGSSGECKTDTPSITTAGMFGGGAPGPRGTQETTGLTM